MFKSPYARLFVILVVACVALPMTSIQAQAPEYSISVGDNAPALRTASYGYPEGSTYTMWAGYWTSLGVKSWDVSCVPEAVWPARDNGIRKIGQDGIAHSLEPGEGQIIYFTFLLKKAGQYEIACYFWAEGKFLGRLPVPVTVVK